MYEDARRLPIAAARVLAEKSGIARAVPIQDIEPVFGSTVGAVVESHRGSQDGVGSPLAHSVDHITLFPGGKGSARSHVRVV